MLLILDGRHTKLLPRTIHDSPVVTAMPQMLRNENFSSRFTLESRLSNSLELDSLFAISEGVDFASLNTMIVFACFKDEVLFGTDSYYITGATSIAVRKSK